MVIKAKIYFILFQESTSFPYENGPWYLVDFDRSLTRRVPRFSPSTSKTNKVPYTRNFGVLFMNEIWKKKAKIFCIWKRLFALGEFLLGAWQCCSRSKHVQIRQCSRCMVWHGQIIHLKTLFDLTFVMNALCHEFLESCG